MRFVAALVCSVVAFGAGAMLAAGGDAPISHETLADATGDAGGGPDISAMTLTVNADATVTFSATLSNRSSLRPDESLQFFITTGTSSGSLNIAAFQSQAAELSTWSGTDWRTQHEIPATWANGTFTTTVSLGDLQNALQAPVRPAIFVSVVSYVGATPDVDPTAVDSAPDTGSFGLETVASAASTTVSTPSSTTPPPPAPTSSSPHRTVPSGARPRFDEKIVRLSHARIEWKRLAIVGIPAKSRVSFTCTKGCKLSEHPSVVRGRATSRKFVGVPFARGASYRVEIVQSNKTGWWWKTTVVAKPAGQETSSAMGCIASDGARVPLSRC